MEITFSPVPSVQLTEALAIFRDAVGQIDEAIYSREQKNAWIEKGLEDYLKWEVRLKNQYFLGAYQDAKLVGFCSVTKTGHVDLLFTETGFQRKNIASNLYDKVEEYLKLHQCQIITTDASHLAYSFFLKKGFKSIRENELDLYGVPIHNFSMEKLL